MRTDDGQDPLIEPSQPQRRPGAELARAREAAGIGLRAMADTLHLPEKQLRALESDDYANLPPPTFVRGYLRSYARALGLDGDEIVGLYDTLEVGAEEPGLRLASGRDNGAHNRGLALAIAVLALAVALSLGAWWWQTRMAESADAGGDAAPAAAAEAADAGNAMSGDDAAAGDGNIDAASSGPGDADGDQGEAAATAAMSGSSADSESSMRSQGGGGNGAAQARGDSGSMAEEIATDEADSPSTATADGSAAAELDEPSAPATSGNAATSGTDENTDDELAAADVSAESGSGSDGAAAEAGSTVALSESGGDDPDGAGSGGSTTSSAAEEGGYQPPPQTASAEAAIAPEASEGPEQLEVSVDGRSWIEIYDARGRELVYTLYTGSEALQVRGWAPFDVFLGNSPDVSIRFNGERIDKAGFTRSDRTARFLVDASGANRR